MEKMIITVAPTGNVPTKQNNPQVPITPDEIAEDIYQCYLAGASVAHIHARDGYGKPTTEPAVFKDIADRVKSKCNIIIQMSTGARGGTPQERGACLELKPEMASLATCSSNFSSSVNYNPPDLIKSLAQKMLENSIKPEVEVFDTAALYFAEYLASEGLLKKPLHYNLVMNVPGSIKGSPKNLFFLLESLPDYCTWTVSGIGKSHQQITGLAIVLGGNVRVGIEDVIELEKGFPVSNILLVKRVVDLAKAYGRKIADANEARAILGLQGQ